MTYFFILGNNPTLSIAEIINVLSKQIVKIEKLSSEVLLIKLSGKVSVLELQNQLGGTIKIGQTVDQVNLNSFSDLVDKIWQNLPKNLSNLYFGLSTYYLGGQKRDISRKLKKAALEVKARLKKQGIACRWVESKEKVLSSVILQKNKLLSSGTEIVFLIDNNKCYIGKTLSCQSFKNYVLKDFGRPDRIIEKGMIPPKLGQIMLNLSRDPSFSLEKTLILDPFCGSGTILQEALLMGFKSIIGTDKNKRAIVSAQKNLEWLVQNIKQSLGGVRIFYSDVRKISKKIRAKSVGAIVTEPYLGPLKFSSSECSFIIRELGQLYLSAFEQFSIILKTNRKVVIIFPIFRIRNKQYFLPILDKLKNQGWQIQSPIPHSLLKSSVIKITKRESIIYSRPGQKVLREILIFKKA
ncbi:hypothetical protein KKG58_02160 [Patescibacteria group bacterium]|nr:hypothetical protein [Patescibacteria group bacterium]